MKKKDILIILFLLLSSVIVWAGTSIYRNLVRSTIPPTTIQDISPIAPTFNIQAIDKIKTREKINPSFVLENRISPTPSLIPTPNSNEEIASKGGKILP